MAKKHLSQPVKLTIEQETANLSLYKQKLHVLLYNYGNFYKLLIQDFCYAMLWLRLISVHLPQLPVQYHLSEMAPSCINRSECPYPAAH